MDHQTQQLEMPPDDQPGEFSLSPQWNWRLLALQWVLGVFPFIGLLILCNPHNVSLYGPKVFSCSLMVGIGLGIRHVRRPIRKPWEWPIAALGLSILYASLSVYHDHSVSENLFSILMWSGMAVGEAFVLLWAKSRGMRISSRPEIQKITHGPTNSAA